MPTYEHLCTKCNHEWEEFYSIKDPVPETCPSCKENGGVKRLVSGGSGRGKVELSGQEYVDKVNADAAAIKREAYRNENVMANMVGEAKYHSDRTRK